MEWLKGSDLLEPSAKSESKLVLTRIPDIHILVIRIPEISVPKNASEESESLFF